MNSTRNIKKVNPIKPYTVISKGGKYNERVEFNHWYYLVEYVKAKIKEGHVCKIIENVSGKILTFKVCDRALWGFEGFGTIE